LPAPHPAYSTTPNVVEITVRADGCQPGKGCVPVVAAAASQHPTGDHRPRLPRRATASSSGALHKPFLLPALRRPAGDTRSQGPRSASGSAA